MRLATLVLLAVALAGVGPLLEAKSPEDALDGSAVFGDLTKEGAAQKARQMAEADFARNIYRFFVAGKRWAPNPSEDYLADKYGVRVTSIAGCVISEGITGAIEGYNSTMKPLLSRKFGRDIFKEAEGAGRR